MICFSHLFVLSSLAQLLFVIVDELPIAGSLLWRAVYSGWRRRTNSQPENNTTRTHTRKHTPSFTQLSQNGARKKGSSLRLLLVQLTLYLLLFLKVFFFCFFLLFFCFLILFPFSIWFGSVSFLLLLFLTICLFFPSFLFRFCWATFLPSRGSGARKRSLFQIMNKTQLFCIAGYFFLPFLLRWWSFLPSSSESLVIFSLLSCVSLSAWQPTFLLDNNKNNSSI